MRHVLANSLLLAAAVAVGAIGIEAGYRFWLTHKFSHAAFPISTVPRFFVVEDERPRQAGDGIFVPDLDIPYRHFGADNRLLFESRIRTNSLGYRAERNWPIQKAPGEFRIAVIGDSMTAGVMSDQAWTEATERALNASPRFLHVLNARRVTVMNFGVVGAGFDTMAQVATDHARRFNPDFTVVSFIGPDIFRPRLNIEPLLDPGPLPRIYQRAVDISAEGLSVQTLAVCTAEPVALGLPHCRPSTVLRVDESVALDPARLQQAKLALSRGILGGEVWRSMRSYALDAALGRPFRLSDNDPFTTSETEEQMVRRSAASIARLRRSAPDALFLYNPTVTELLERTHRPALAENLRQAANLPLVWMGERLPQASAEEIRAWFNLPHDTHFSNRGAEIYGFHAAEAIARRILTGQP